MWLRLEHFLEISNFPQHPILPIRENSLIRNISDYSRAGSTLEVWWKMEATNS
jgi:hypothetical protein